MLRKFKINIDGQEYVVEMEEIGGQPTPNIQSAPPVQEVPQAAPQAPVEEEKTTPVAAGPTNAAEAPGEAMEAPMPGTILEVFVELGQEVKENEKLLILEAMKMENEIVSSKNGKVTGIFVNKGDSIDAGTPLITVD